ncbi:hypothetical protein [Hymenobacter actinosclerus]|uniref:Uncharacterized protein n=1 Tax=Hymenobacter actinosclerus TaxID=82805 RepID=A0A1I0DP76_9BACT|nr:hypothetical protein [Hymenobacter actinosclerus]SET34166.1 hypothetical protein SAMN04487998_1488 [Hymenobacter actinosclerus]
MRQLVVRVPDEKYGFLMELLGNLSFVETEPVKPAALPALTSGQQERVGELREALQEVERHQRGEIQLRSLDELIDEL